MNATSTRMVETRHADNLGRAVTFALDGEQVTRRLVLKAADWRTEVCVGTPVGAVLRRAVPGRRMTVDAPGGPVEVEVISVEYNSVEQDGVEGGDK